MPYFKAFSIVSLGFLCLSGCSFENSIPSDTEMQPIQAERAVYVSKVENTGSGFLVTCELNDSLVSPNLEIPLFLEHNGNEIQRTVLQNQAAFTFNEYTPTSQGKMVCVVEFASNEFESEQINIMSSP